MDASEPDDDFAMHDEPRRPRSRGAEIRNGSMTQQREIDSGNATFWNELCGTQLAKSLGVIDASPTSLKRFDDWYLAFYPYLASHIPFAAMAGRDVLEIGLGYGTVSQKIAASGARYCGLDIARGPVDMVNHRLRQAGLPGEAQQGSVLAAPFPDAQLRPHRDHRVPSSHRKHARTPSPSVTGCSAPGAFSLSWSTTLILTDAGGRLHEPPCAIWRRRSADIGELVPAASAAERGAYDTDQAGAAAPHTDYISVKSLRDLCSNFTAFSATRENIAEEPPFRRISRDRLLNTFIPAIAGLDIYVTARK